MACNVSQVNYKRAFMSAEGEMMSCSVCPWFDQRFSFIALARLNLQNVNILQRAYMTSDDFRPALRFKAHFSLVCRVFELGTGVNLASREF